jgi:hypothetical protein
LRAPSANYHQGDSSLVWDWKNNSQLRFLDEDEEGKVEFWIDLKEDLSSTENNNKNLSLKNSVNLAPAKEEFSVKVNSKLVLEQKGFFADETFNNSGPLPPQAGQTTNFTITWRLKNYYNDLRNVKVKAVLPSFVSLTGQLFPRDASFVFDSQSREIIWEVGEVQAGGGESPNLSFQISLNPSLSQQGQTAEIVSKSQAFGDDAWTQSAVASVVQTLTTGLLSDEGFTPAQGIVQ